MVALYQHYPLSLIVLCPRPEVVAARDAARTKTGYSDQSAVLAFDRVLREETPRLGYWLDNSDLTVVETIDRILPHLAETSSTARHSYKNSTVGDRTAHYHRRQNRALSARLERRLLLLA